MKKRIIVGVVASLITIGVGTHHHTETRPMTNNPKCTSGFPGDHLDTCKYKEDQ